MINLGDALSILKQMPDKCIDFCMTSPLYWNKREYPGGTGMENSIEKYQKYLFWFLLKFTAY
jgi:DNA modification methylase